jgi:hypothetical protein
MLRECYIQSRRSHFKNALDAERFASASTTAR